MNKKTAKLMLAISLTFASLGAHAEKHTFDYNFIVKNEMNHTIDAKGFYDQPPISKIATGASTIFDGPRSNANANKLEIRSEHNKEPYEYLCLIHYINDNGHQQLVIRGYYRKGKASCEVVNNKTIIVKEPKLKS